MPHNSETTLQLKQHKRKANCAPLSLSRLPQGRNSIFTVNCFPLLVLGFVQVLDYMERKTYLRRMILRVQKCFEQSGILKNFSGEEELNFFSKEFF